MMYPGALAASKPPPATRPSVTAGLKWPPEMGPTAKAIAMTDRPTATATATSPVDGAENSAAPHTAVTSVNVPMNSAPSSRGDMSFPPNEFVGARRVSPARITSFTRRSEEHTSELQSLAYLVCRLLLEK